MDKKLKNCFVCNDYLGPFRNSLKTKMELSGKSIYKVLGKFFNELFKKVKSCQKTLLDFD